MKTTVIAAFAVFILAAGPTVAKPFIYDETAIPQTGKLSKAPVGSTVEIDSTGKFGIRYGNIFKVQPDRSLKLIRQYKSPVQPLGR